MRVLIILCACVTLVKCNIGPTANTITTSGHESQPSRIIGIIGSPVGGPFGHAPLQILPANFLSSFNRAPTNQPLGHFQPFLHQPVVTPQNAPPKRQVSQTEAISSSGASSAAESSVGGTSATASASSVAAAQSAPVQFVSAAPSNQFIAAAAPSNQFVAAAAPSNQVLGILQPSPPPTRSNDILSTLLPEFIEITNKLEERGLTGSGRTHAEEIVKSFMPLMRKVMINNAEAEGRSLTAQEVDAINFAEKTVGPFVTFGYDVSDNGKGFNNPAVPKNDVPNDFFAQMMVDLLPDLTRVVNQVKNQYSGWPGTGSAVEVMNLFIPFARRVVESQARIEGRFISREEQDYLRFGEDVVPILMKYAQESFVSGKSLEAAEKYNVVDLVQNAWAKLHKEPSF